VRILFRNLGQAEFFLKTSKKALANNLIAPDGGRLPTQRVRNALCKGLEYSSYDELKLIMSRRHEGDNTSHPQMTCIRRSLKVSCSPSPLPRNMGFGSRNLQTY